MIDWAFEVLPWSSKVHNLSVLAAAKASYCYRSSSLIWIVYGITWKLISRMYWLPFFAFLILHPFSWHYFPPSPLPSSVTIFWVWMHILPKYESGEANFLGGVASVKGVKGFNPEAAKKRFFEIYLDKVIE